MEIMLPEGPIMRPEDCIMLPEGCRRPDDSDFCRFGIAEEALVANVSETPHAKNTPVPRRHQTHVTCRDSQE